MNIFCWRLFGVNYLDFFYIKNPRDMWWPELYSIPLWSRLVGLMYLCLYWTIYFLVSVPISYIKLIHRILLTFTGLLLFGVLRGKCLPEVLLFPLDFTAAGGVASTPGLLRIAYAAYLEIAVMLASTNVALLRVFATRGFTTFGIRQGLMINTPK